MAEQSVMSQMSQVSEMSSVTTEDAGHDGGKKFRSIIVVLLLLLLGAGSLYFILPGGSDDGDSSDGEGSDSSGGGFGSSGGGPSGGTVVIEKKTTTTTKRTRRPRTTEGITFSPTPDQFQEPAPTPRTDRKPRHANEDLLLCTVSHRAFNKEVYPDDGLCDLLYYTTAYYDPAKKEFWGAFDALSFGVFREKVKASSATSKTSYGISFDYRYGKMIADQLKTSDGQNSFQGLWNDRIYHYGILHVLANSSEFKSTDRLQLLKELKKRQDALGNDKKGHLALGFQFIEREEYKKIAETANYLLKNYPITIMVTATHTFKLFGGYTVGPSSWGLEKRPYEMVYVADQWTNITTNDSITIMPSYTMKAYSWKTDDHPSYTRYTDGWWLFHWYTPTVQAQACEETEAQAQSPGMDDSGLYMFTGNKSAVYFLTYDTAETMKLKMENFFNFFNTSMKLPPKHGWAVYDVDFDHDTSNLCGKGSYSRLKQIRRYMRR